MKQTQRQILHRVLWGAAVLGWMGIIFYFSAQNGEDSSAVSGGITDRLLHLLWRNFDQMTVTGQEQLRGQLTFVVRKGAHFTEYAILGFLVSGFLGSFSIGIFRRVPIAWLCGTLYACSDELHQMFTDGRSPKLFDLMVDSAGVLTGVGIFLLLAFLYMRWKKHT